MWSLVIFLPMFSLSVAGDKNFSQRRLRAGRGEEAPLVRSYQPHLQDSACDLCGEQDSDISHFLLPRYCCPHSPRPRHEKFQQSFDQTESFLAQPYVRGGFSNYNISLARCPELQDRKEALLHYWRSVIRKHPTVSNIVEEIIQSKDEELFLSLILDCSSVPRVSRAAQTDPTVLPLLFKERHFLHNKGRNIFKFVFQITNIWSYSLFRARLKNLGRWAADSEQ